MVNFGLNSASILGIFLAVAGASLYFLRSVRPELSRDHDIFFAAVGLLCGFILLFQGWRLDPILQFGQFLLTGSAIFFAVESIRLRGVATEQARRNTPIVDDDRPVGRVYRAELDQIEPYGTEERRERRLRGYPEPRTSRGRGYEDETPRSSSRPTPPPTSSRNRPPSRDSYSNEPPTRKRRPRSAPSQASRDPYDNFYGEYENGRDVRDVRDVWTEDDMWDDGGDIETSPPPRRPRRPRPDSEVSRRPSRPRPDDYRPDEDVPTVDYQPIDEPQLDDEPQDWDDPGEDDVVGDNPTRPVNFDY